MPLEAPQLDNRKFDDLLREAQLRIPRYAPEWTDFNESDPGMTLVQLFAWLTEMMLYRMNRVPERNYIKFLQLIGLELQPAQPATAHLTINAKVGAPEVRSVPRRAQIQGQPLEGDPLIFETLEGLDLIRVPLEDVQVFDGAAFTKVSELNKSQSTAFPPFGWIPQVGSALYLGFNPEGAVADVRQFPRLMRFRVFLPAESQAGQPVRCNEEAEAPTAPVDLIWEYRPKSDPTRWRRLNVFKDESVGFTREGYILVEGPKDPAITAGLEKVPESRFWLRVRLAARSYPAGRAPVIDFIRPNTVEVENLSTIRDEVMGPPSEGVPDQTFTFVKRPVRRDPLQIVTVERVGEEDVEESWQLVEDFLASGPEDRHFVLNPTRGDITFGNGERGLIPPPNAEIIARLYRFGGGSAGNLGLGTEWTPATPLIGTDKVIGERPATGGRDEQKVEELTAIAPRIMRSRDRAITAGDFAALASQAGEVRKANAIPLANPNHPGVEISGAVTVVIVPDADIEDPSPKPSADLISRVCQYLDDRRLLTTELFIKGPEYKQIKVEARVEANPYAAFDTVELNVSNAINTYLDPLGRTFTDGATQAAAAADPATPAASTSQRGWDFGRDLFPTNLYSVILGVEDVVAVPFLEIRVDGQQHAINDPVTLAGDGLFYGAPDHEIVVVPAIDR